MSDAGTAELVARLEARVIELERRLAQYEKPHKPTPVASYPDGRTTISTVQYRVVLPTADELRQLEEIVLRQYPKLRAGSDSASFRAAFCRLTYTRRAETPDGKRDLESWVDEAEEWLKAQHYYPSRPATQSFATACIAIGDIPFTNPALFPSMRVGITGLPQFEPLPGRWRAVLESNQAPLPIADR
jgi:hypothetical protein